MGRGRAEVWEGRPPGRIPDHQLRKDRGNGQRGPQKLHLKGLQVSSGCLQQVRAGAPCHAQGARLCSSDQLGKEGPQLNIIGPCCARLSGALHPAPVAGAQHAFVAIGIPLHGGGSGSGKLSDMPESPVSSRTGFKLLILS